MTAHQQFRSFCRTCGGACGVILDVDGDGRLAAVHGDKDHPLTQGYICIKGARAADVHNSPQRVTRPLKKMADGSFQEIPLAQALDEIAAKLRAIGARDGNEANAIYHGTQASTNTATVPMIRAWVAASNSRMCSSMSIDQVAKVLAAERLGTWAGGVLSFQQSDVWMCFGSNPLVSVMGGFNGFYSLNPTKRIKEAKARGMKIIVIDPRRSETAHYADIHLQPYPGQDTAIAAGMIRRILEQGWHDAEFCARWANGLAQLREMVEPFTPDVVAQRAGIDKNDFLRAVELFAASGRKGGAFTGTGPDMAAHCNVAEHLIQCLNIICGRYPKAGDKVQNPGAISPSTPMIAQVNAPTRAFDKTPKGRIGGYSQLLGEFMTGTLPDEITTPGKGRIRSLICVGGNPAAVVPDQKKIVDALRDLELLVAVDPLLTQTAQLAHYVIPPKLQFERSDLPRPWYERTYFDQAYSQYAAPVVQPPAGSEVIDDWLLFVELAKRLDLSLNYYGVDLDLNRPIDNDYLLSLIMQGAPLSFDELKQHPEGLTNTAIQFVEVAPASASGRFEITPPDVIEEFKQYESDVPAAGFSHLLAVRRIREAINSHGVEYTEERRMPHANPVHLNPADLHILGLREGHDVMVSSANGSVIGRAVADDSLRSGVITMNHGWGDLPGKSQADIKGSSVNLLISLDSDLQPITAMPRMSAIPVNIVALVTAQSA